jgi:DNA-binding MarR family transcriptional regulator
MESSMRSAGHAEDLPQGLAALQSATRILTGVALRSLEVLDGAVTLPQFRMLAVLADLGQARSVRVARAMGLDASTVTRLADRLVAAGYVIRGSEPGHRGVVTLGLTREGERLVSKVVAWRQEELARMFCRLAPADRVRVVTALEKLVAAAGEGYGTVSRALVPV